MNPDPNIRFVEFNWQPANWIITGLGLVSLVQSICEIRWW